MKIIFSLVRFHFEITVQKRHSWYMTCLLILSSPWTTVDRCHGSKFDNVSLSCRSSRQSSRGSCSISIAIPMARNLKSWYCIGMVWVRECMMRSRELKSLKSSRHASKPTFLKTLSYIYAFHSLVAVYIASWQDFILEDFLSVLITLHRGHERCFGAVRFGWAFDELQRFQYFPACITNLATF